MDNLGVLFLELLELYGTAFNYDAVGVTIVGRGGYFRKVWTRTRHWPRSVRVWGYSRRSIALAGRTTPRAQNARGWLQPHKPSLLSIEDPQDPSRRWSWAGSQSFRCWPCSRPPTPSTATPCAHAQQTTCPSAPTTSSSSGRRWSTVRPAP